jgi:hypothetical protein
MNRIQIIATVVSFLIFFSVFNLIRRRKLKTEYSLIWLSVSVAFIVFSLWKNSIDWLAAILGIDYAPSVLFLVLLAGIVLILIKFSIIISDQAERIKVLTQELGLIKLELEHKIDKMNKKNLKNDIENELPKNQ